MKKRKIRKTAAVVGHTRDRLAAALRKAFRSEGFMPDVNPEDIRAHNVKTGRRWSVRITLYKGPTAMPVALESVAAMSVVHKAGVKIMWTGPNSAVIEPDTRVDYQQLVA